MATPAPSVLTVENLSVAVGDLTVVEGVGFELRAGQTLALVGESGCGKSMTALALTRLHPGNVAVGGRVVLLGTDLLRLTESEMQTVRGKAISMIFQEPTAALDPLMPIGRQIVEAIQAHPSGAGRLPAADARRRAVEILRLVGMADPEARVRQRPFELSGGMCQRVMIATALACEPAVLIADEPTTALDVTVQAQILALIDDRRRRAGTAVLLITHDMGVVADVAERVAVMYAGRIVEEGPVDEIFSRPRHPYTHLLLRSVPRLDDRRKQRLHVIEGVVPDPQHWPSGCRFHPRCPYATDRCAAEQPPLEATGVEHAVHLAACWHGDDLDDLDSTDRHRAADRQSRSTT